jgi:hypothetical protein
MHTANVFTCNYGYMEIRSHFGDLEGAGRLVAARQSLQRASPAPREPHFSIP